LVNRFPSSEFTSDSMNADEMTFPPLAQAALAEIRSPEVAPALHELQDLGERLRQHINRIDGARHRPRRRTRA
jgi:hypothetical protein